MFNLVLNAVSATMAILRRTILVAFYDTHEDTEDTFSTWTPGPLRGHGVCKHRGQENVSNADSSWKNDSISARNL